MAIFSGRTARSLLGLNNFMILSSSAILTGILSYFLHRGLRLTHLIYNEVIAVITLFFYLFAVVLPVLKAYRGYMLPLNLILTYLWLTSLIFSSQDYSGGRCRWNALFSRCGLKHAVQAFFIIGFCFLLFNTILEALMWANHWRSREGGAGDPEKDRPLATTTGANTAGETGGTSGAGGA
ncbi:hypothetical protein MYCTH_2116433 [Thermothelomyces thermophilus ATCC 42464]|uniref:MARVEL domain-containing protein n=1 Tax=Thermothelomyces thermophilus (strain ATCC 42464 / BCRC 31852 / DSM 1799) TaxID=573729 RepID=G2Q058_THET4|nr:uncharacterized protein MYCTH_2116433 [Thermothelomyces thermophilus ATCC 42464]AEO55732.1 hypothetical protein MYCTH_2116433 [Thermothelomyces thermophilus ATCC 42464]